MYNSRSLFGNGLIFQTKQVQKNFKETALNTTVKLSGTGAPEQMFQDWEYIPSFLISERSLHRDAFK